MRGRFQTRKNTPKHPGFSYSQRAQRLGEMMRSKRFSPKERILEAVEYSGKFWVTNIESTIIPIFYGFPKTSKNFRKIRSNSRFGRGRLLHGNYGIFQHRRDNRLDVCTFYLFLQYLLSFFEVTGRKKDEI